MTIEIVAKIDPNLCTAGADCNVNRAYRGLSVHEALEGAEKIAEDCFGLTIVEPVGSGGLKPASFTAECRKCVGSRRESCGKLTVKEHSPIYSSRF